MGEFSWVTLLAAFTACAFFPPPALADDKFSELKAQYDELREDLERPVDKLDSQYEESLKELSDRAQESSNLELLIAAKDELEHFRSNSSLSRQTEVRRLQEIYRRESARIRVELADRHAELIGAHLVGLNTLLRAHTRAGNIDEAVRYRDEITHFEELRTQLSQRTPKPASGTTPLDERLPGTVWSYLTESGRGTATVRFEIGGKAKFSFTRAADLDRTWRVEDEAAIVPYNSSGDFLRWQFSDDFSAATITNSDKPDERIAARKKS